MFVFTLSRFSLVPPYTPIHTAYITSFSTMKEGYAQYIMEAIRDSSRNLHSSFVQGFISVSVGDAPAGIFSCKFAASHHYLMALESEILW